MKWYAVQTKSRQENIAKENLDLIIVILDNLRDVSYKVKLAVQPSILTSIAL